MSQIRYRIEQLLSSFGIKYSTQVVNALKYASIHSSPEIVGCSDSLLLGLLGSGSYTIDALIDSGVHIKELKRLVDLSVKYFNWNDCDPVSMLFSTSGVFGGYLDQIIGKQKYLETADLLEMAISPESYGFSSDRWFPKELRVTPPPKNNISKSLEEQICYIIDGCIEIISKRPYVTLTKRKRSLNDNEVKKIEKEFGKYLSNPEIKLAISLTNEWLTNKRLVIEDYKSILGICDRLYEGTLIGSSLFLESGGNFNTLSTALQIAKRYAPERDQPILALVERSGRIYIKPYSYRNSSTLEFDQDQSVLSIGSEIPLPVTTLEILAEFEEILNVQNVKEETIQKFLESYPEILRSLGYASCLPHVILREHGKKDLIPDFILQRPGNNGFDILDLKLPTAKVAISNPYLRISHEITKALAQLRAYRNYFNNRNNVSKFYRTYHLEPLSPELVVVIGRRLENLSYLERSEINEQSKGIRIISYDELLDYGKSRLINFTNRQ
jgi:hypothetical protein